MKLAIGAVVGGIILFLWQFISFAALDLHYNQMAVVPQGGEEIMQVLSKHLTEGEYMVPRLAQGASTEAQEAYMEKYTNKPLAMINYREKITDDMSMNMIRGLIIDIVSVGLLCFILLKIPDRNMLSILSSSIAVGLIGYFTINYLDTIWFKGTSIPDLIDAVAQWGICGLWLGFWLKK